MFLYLIEIIGKSIAINNLINGNKKLFILGKTIEKQAPVSEEKPLLKKVVFEREIIALVLTKIKLIIKLLINRYSI